MSRGRLSEFVTRLLGLPETPALTMAPEVVPVVQLAPPQLEDYLSRSERLFTFHINLAQTAAQMGRVRIGVPPSASILAVVDRITFQSTQASRARAGVNVLLSNLTNPGTPVSRDGRLIPPGNAVVTYEMSAAAFSILANLVYKPMAAGEFLELDPSVVLSPGYCLEFGLDIVNTDAWLSMQWRERALPELERVP